MMISDETGETARIYDEAGRLIYVISEGRVTAYSYDENGNRSKVVYPDGKTKEEYEYYKDNLLKKLTNTKADGTTMEEYSYSYDGAHNQLSKTEIINGKEKGTTSYTYDRLNRLIEILEPIKETETAGRITSYTYDAAGNRETERTTTSNAAGTKTTLIAYKYNEQNRLMSTTEETGDGTKKTTTYTYDGNGNMTRKSMEQTRKIDPLNAPKASFGIYIEGQAEVATKNAKPIVSGVASYEYSVWNQLKKATTAEGTSTYKYNGEGYRTEKTENGKTTISIYEADRVILETAENGKEIARNLYGTNLITRTVTENSAAQNGSTQKTSYNYLYNGHGDVTTLLTQEGTIAASYYYDAFGTTLETHYYNASGAETDKAVDNPYRYAGYMFDSMTDLYYLNARYYDSKIARFMSEDTYTGEVNDPLSLNLYTYCANNPVMYIDPTGHRYNFLTGGDDGAGSSIVIGVSNSGALISVPRESNNSGSAFNIPQTSGSITYSYNNSFGNSTLNINNTGDIRTLNTGNLSVNLNNTGTIGKVSTGDNSVTNINNSRYIGTINTGSSSATSINNSGYIDVINSGAGSRTNISNSGYIGVFNTGIKSTNEVTNSAFIGIVNTGTGNTTTLSSGGYYAYAGGQGTILYNINGVIVPENIYNKAIIEAQKQIDAILSQYYYAGFWHGGGYFLVEDTYAYGLYNNLKSEVHGYKFRSSALEASIVPATIYEAYGTVKEQCGPMPPMYTLAATAYVSIFSFLDIDDGTPSLSASDILKEIKEKQKESKSVATALAKFNYVMNSDYRYLMLGFEGRGEFIDKLAILNENMNKSDYNIFKNSKDNEAYKTALISYIDNIYNMNVNFSTNNTVLQKILNNVANNVSKVDAQTINEMVYK